MFSLLDLKKLSDRNLPDKVFKLDIIKSLPVLFEFVKSMLHVDLQLVGVEHWYLDGSVEA